MLTFEAMLVQSVSRRSLGTQTEINQSINRFRFSRVKETIRFSRHTYSQSQITEFCVPCELGGCVEITSDMCTQNIYCRHQASISDNRPFPSLWLFYVQTVAQKPNNTHAAARGHSNTGAPLIVCITLLIHPSSGSDRLERVNSFRLIAIARLSTHSLPLILLSQTSACPLLFFPSLLSFRLWPHST